MLLSIKTAWVHAARRLVSHNSAQHYSYLSPYCLIVVNLSTIVASLILTFFGHIHLKWEKEQLIASPWNLCVFEICAEKIGRNFGAVCKFKMGETIRSFTIRTYHMVVKGGGRIKITFHGLTLGLTRLPQNPLELSCFQWINGPHQTPFQSFSSQRISNHCLHFQFHLITRLPVTQVDSTVLPV